MSEIWEISDIERRKLFNFGGDQSILIKDEAAVCLHNNVNIQLTQFDECENKGNVSYHQRCLTLAKSALMKCFGLSDMWFVKTIIKIPDDGFFFFLFSFFWMLLYL